MLDNYRENSKVSRIHKATSGGLADRFDREKSFWGRKTSGAICHLLMTILDECYSSDAIGGWVYTA